MKQFEEYIEMTKEERERTEANMALLNEYRRLHQRMERRRKQRQVMWKILKQVAWLILFLLGIQCIVGYLSSVSVKADYQSPPTVVHGEDPVVLWEQKTEIPATEPCVLSDEELEAAENELIEAALLQRASVIEDCTVTRYCAERYPHICGTGDGLTATGTKVTPYVSCAVDPRYIPYGSTVMVDFGDGELHYYVADDCGSAIKGSHIDLCVSSHKEALQLGTTKATVYWCKEG